MKYNQKVISFFKRHNIYDEEMFTYFSNNSTMIDYDIEEFRPFVGCWPNINKENIIIGLHVNTPYVKNDETMLITIHELIHALELYNKIGKPYNKDITVESLPILYEKLYILENNNPLLTQYGNYLDSMIDSNIKNEYSFALKIREELLKNYDYDIEKMQRLTKKLSKKIK